MVRKKLNWGILGAAKIARSIALALQKSKYAQPHAISSRALPKAEAFAREYGFANSYGSYSALLEDPDVDVVYIPLPNHLHCPWTIRALQAGKHVLCEKPLANSASESRKMIDAAKRNHRLLMEAFMYRLHPQTLKIQELLRKGTIGVPRVIRAAFGFTLDLESKNVRLEPRMGGGCLMDVGCYCVNAIRTFFGEEPSSVIGHAKYGKRTGADLSFAGTLIFREGKLGIFSSSFQTTLDRGVEIIGTHGRILLPSPWKPDGTLSSFTLEIKGTSKSVEIRNGGGIYLNEVEHFSLCVMADRTPLLPSEDGFRNMVVIDALKKSARTGRETKL